MRQYLTVGLAVLGAAALVEAALIPGVLIGGAAILAPKVLPGLRRRIAPLMDGAAGGRAQPAARRPAAQTGVNKPAGATAILPALGIKQAIAKTITFRVIVTVLDFTSNYVVIGEFNAAAGLSTFALVVGPVFYLAHETAWNYLHPGDGAVDVSLFMPLPSDAGTEDGERSITISRALAKTVTFRTIATAIDYTALYVVTADPLTAAGLAAWGFVVGPFVYWGHEKLWERFSAPEEGSVDAPEPMKLLPAPVGA
ncbi:MAG TPA: DUF2061 domain-containing protein [Xanthobacteraceae bacterium]|jgi:uncharacterized membrane protein|nr:DUF2061 domain-containing protein [Xanthobacteraceae bacterium]